MAELGDAALLPATRKKAGNKLMTTASPNATALASVDTAKRQHAALIAAERLLADTAETINPGTPAADMLACLTKYHAHLSKLAGATRVTVSGLALSAGPR